jgi:hypothetical protein
MINLDTINYNLQLLEEVKKEYPILQDYQDGKVLYDSVSNVGLDQFVSLVDLIKSCGKYGIELVYTKKIRYREIKLKIVEFTSSDKAKSIFKNKTQEDFKKIYTDFKHNRRYTRSINQSYCSALEYLQPLFLNFFVQNSIEFNKDFFNCPFYFRKLSKPQLYSRELKMTQDLLDMFIEFTTTQDFDLRKCNIKSFTSELNSRLKRLMKIDQGLLVKCINPINHFTIGNHYEVQDSRINYSGFLEIRLTDDRNNTQYVSYSPFEEVSRQRSDILKELGL